MSENVIFQWDCVTEKYYKSQNKSEFIIFIMVRINHQNFHYFFLLNLRSELCCNFRN